MEGPKYDTEKGNMVRFERRPQWRLYCMLLCLVSVRTNSGHVVVVDAFNGRALEFEARTSNRVLPNDRKAKISKLLSVSTRRRAWQSREKLWESARRGHHRYVACN